MNENIQAVMDATSHATLFGTNEKRAKITYRRLARAVHPDMYPDDEKDDAQKAFAKLSLFWEKHLHDSPANNGTKPAPGSSKNSIKTKKHEYVLGDTLKGDPFFSRYEASFDAGYEKCSVLIARNNADNDLAEKHASALKTLAQEVPEQYKGFYPQLIESFRYRTPDNKDHFATAERIPDGFSPFRRILEVYPNGVGGRDIGWIFRRMLVAVGNAHDAGLTHGGVSLDSLFVHPEQHGLILSDWQYSTEDGQALKAVPAEWKGDYPEKYLKKEPASYALDINLCGKVAERLLSKDAPKQFRTFFKACTLEKPLPASQLLREFDLLLERLYGKPKFHHFTLNP